MIYFCCFFCAATYEMVELCVISTGHSFRGRWYHRCCFTSFNNLHEKNNPQQSLNIISALLNQVRTEASSKFKPLTWHHRQREVMRLPIILKKKNTEKIIFFVVKVFHIFTATWKTTMENDAERDNTYVREKAEESKCTLLIDFYSSLHQNGLC